MLQGFDVLERVVGDGDQIGVVAGGERADIFGAADEIGGVPGGGLDGLCRGHSIHDHVVELLCVVAVWVDAGVGAEGHLDAGRDGLAEVFPLQLANARSLSMNSCGMPKSFALPRM